MGFKNKIVKAAEWFDDRKVAVLAVIFFVLSLIPILYLAKYARPSGDDYGYSALTHAAWLDTHSLIEVFKAGIQTVKEMYEGWNGDWFTVFLFSLMPEVFAPYTYWIVPYIMVGALILGTTVFLSYTLGKIAGLGWEYVAIFDVLILFVSLQFIPSTGIGMYWYVGATHYIIPHAAALFALVFGFRFYRTGKRRNVVYASICMFMVGGSSYFSSLLVFMVFALLMLLFFKKKKSILYLLIPFAIGAVGFIIQCISPGNKVRAGESFGFSPLWAAETIARSLWQGITLIGMIAKEKPFVLMALFFCAVFGWLALLKRKSDFKFRFPVLFVLLMYGIYSAMYAPAIYSSVGVSLGPDTMVYLTFLLTSLLSVLYVEGWLIQKCKEKRKEGKILFDFQECRLKAAIPVLLLCLLITVWNREWFGSCVDKRVYDYVSSGQAEDFKSQIASQMEILLDDSVREAYVVPTNDDQGPLLHMPITDNENAFTNWAAKNFYRKDKVVLIEQGNIPE